MNEPTPSLEGAGIYPGSRLVTTPDEQAAIDRAEHERIERANAELDADLARAWSCQSCGAGNSIGNANGLCDACTGVVRQLTAERHAAEQIGGRSRRQLAEAFLDRHGTS